MSEQTKPVFERQPNSDGKLNIQMLTNIHFDIYEKYSLSIPVEYIEKILLEAEKYVKESESSDKKIKA